MYVAASPAAVSIGAHTMANGVSGVHTGIRPNHEVPAAYAGKVVRPRGPGFDPRVGHLSHHGPLGVEW